MEINLQSLKSCLRKSWRAQMHYYFQLLTSLFNFDTIADMEYLKVSFCWCIVRITFPSFESNHLNAKQNCPSVHLHELTSDNVTCREKNECGKIDDVVDHLYPACLVPGSRSNYSTDIHWTWWLPIGAIGKHSQPMPCSVKLVCLDCDITCA